MDAEKGVISPGGVWDGEMQQLFLPGIARAWGVEKWQIYILIQSGSHGFGHQICQDTLNSFIKPCVFGLGATELAPIFRQTGQPVLEP